VKTIVVGYDGSDSADRALDRAAEFARAFGAKLVVVSVAELPAYAPPYAAGPETGLTALPVQEPVFADITPEEVLGGVLDTAKERLEGVDADYEARTGTADDAIIEVADERGADLIVVGTREPGFLSRLFEGSVSRDLAKRAHCDVLIVHPQHAAAHR
jgi:nucleotide-binding universal stress UspA family protein